MDSNDSRNPKPTLHEGRDALLVPTGEDRITVLPSAELPADAPPLTAGVDGDLSDEALPYDDPVDETTSSDEEELPYDEDLSDPASDYIPEDEEPLTERRAQREDRRLRGVALVAILVVAGAALLLPRLRSCEQEPADSGLGAPPTGTTFDSMQGVNDGEILPAPTESRESTPDTPDATAPSDESVAPLPGTPGETSDAESTTQPTMTESTPDESLADSGSAFESDATPEPPPDTVPAPVESEPTASESPETAPATPPDIPPETAPDTTPEVPPETASPTMPAGAFPIVRVDLSEPDRSVGYIHSTADRLPPSIPAAGTRLWSTASQPTVLLVHTHPYEGYHDGADWYDPASGSLAQTDAPSDPDGVVALGAALTRYLRDAEVTVIHLRVPVAEGESIAATYARTEETVRYYCELYPDIGFVLDLRRSAELSENGEILRTAGQYKGEDCAQLRLSVSGDRPTESVSRDIALAVALRRALWAEEPTISRPVWVKSGEGLVGDLDRVAHLTVEMGASGNSFTEASRLVAPLGDAIAELVKK